MNNIRLVMPMLLLLFAAVGLPSVHADYSVGLQGNTFNVTWTINAVQNLTSYPVSTTIYPPNLHVSLSGNDLSQFSSSIQNALQMKDPGITVSGASLQLVSNNINTTCTSCNQWLNATASFQVHEPATTHYGVSQYDMSWMALRLNEDLAVGNTNYNLIGQDYLLAAAGPISRFTPTSDHSQVMKVDGNVVNKIGYQPYVGALAYFDMSALKTPLQLWSHSFNLTSQTWTSPQIGGFNFTVAQNYLSENTVIVNLAKSSVSAKFSAPNTARASGSTLFVDYTGGVWDQAGVLIILGSIVALAATVIIDKRLTKGYDQKRKRKQKSP